MILLPGDLLLLLFAMVTLIILLLFWLAREQKTSQSTAPVTGVLPSGLQLQPQPFLSQTHALFYNLIRLAVQDQYLVFAQVPLWAVVQAPNPDHRRAFLRHMAFRKLDFVLVHPGTLLAEKIVELHSSPDTAEERGRSEGIRAAIQLAGLELIQLSTEAPYTVAGIAIELGVASVED